ncbi:anion transporter [Methylovirgula sp. 4M-Z18]|uniref:anion transporter n=1 Tax=Methylovirgula sp. 4M-Z18 TaxID=2293567 RepID=UPI000E2F3606|nr:anion transporter [Methylovirgula sp. 4M-Z18]RFB78289.1 anion transporter [Methylovirgula sp. 4M-Z18]
MSARATRINGRPRAGFSFLLIFAVVGIAVVAALAPVFLPADGPLVAKYRDAAAAIIFASSYIALAVGRIPGFRIDRAGIALVGAGLMVAADVVTLDDAYQTVDLNTVTLLLGMMIVVAVLRLSGFFAVASNWLAAWARRPVQLLAAIIVLSGFLSAFLVNDAICLVLTPLVLDLCLSLKRPPAPYLLAVAMASNVGSVATITGNPQNILIGSFSHISYAHFTLALAPVALIGLCITGAFIVLFYRREFIGAPHLSVPPASATVHHAIMGRALLATLMMIGLFFAGVVPAKAAIIIGGLLLLTRRIKSRRVYAEIDWSLLLMFAGLFVIVGGAEHALVTPDVVAWVGQWRLDQIPALTAVTAGLSNLVSNVPAVLMLKPFIEPLPNHTTAWLVVAMASTLAGNFTVLGSVANLIVVQRAASAGVAISFWDYFKVGAPVTCATLIVGALWLWL